MLGITYKGKPCLCCLELVSKTFLTYTYMYDAICSDNLLKINLQLIDSYYMPNHKILRKKQCDERYMIYDKVETSYSQKNIICSSSECKT